MKIIIEQSAGKDYPINRKDDAVFYADQKETIRRRLGLRSTDQIELREV